MNSNFVIISFISLSMIFIFNEGNNAFECPLLNTTKPKFSKSMETHYIMNEDQDMFILCCVFGIKLIRWSFRGDYYGDNWKAIENSNIKYILTNPRQLRIIKPKPGVNNGTYRCEYWDYSDNRYFSEAHATVARKPDQKIRINETSKSHMFIYPPENNLRAYCLVHVYKNILVHFIWNRITNQENQSIISGHSLTKRRMHAPLIEGYKGSANLERMPLNNFHHLFNFTLHISYVDEKFSGTYSCLVMDSDYQEKRIFQFLMEIKTSNMNILIFGIFSSLFTIFAFVTWMFRYDLKRLVKQFIRKFLMKEKVSGKYNFIFIYEFDHESEFQIVYEIVKDIEIRGFSSFFYHRDQIYGKDMIEDIMSAMRSADMAVIWTTKNIWKCTISYFCLQILIDKFENVKRVYVIKSNKKESLKYCSNKAVLVDTKSTMSSKLFLWGSIVYRKSDKTKLLQIWFNHYLLSWLISCLPLKLGFNRFNI